MIETNYKLTDGSILSAYGGDRAECDQIAAGALVQVGQREGIEIAIVHAWAGDVIPKGWIRYGPGKGSTLRSRAPEADLSENPA